MNKKTCVVVVPLHKSDPSVYELISFKQCFSILERHAIKVIAPEHLNLKKYRDVVSTFDVLFISAKWLSSISAYNRLKTSRFFYTLFKEYEFLLTYELDAFVFRDDLGYWCGRGYDYIGAPWLEGWDKPSENLKFTGVGNSGFSLRRIEPISKTLKRMFYKNPLEYQNGSFNRLKAYLKSPYRWIRNQAAENYTVQNNYDWYEDRFFSEVMPLYQKTFKIAPVEEAIRFSFEVKPEHLFELNDRQLPMGCHAWWRYNLPFWKPHIEQFGYQL